jgi:hypothetical protein
MTERRPNVAVIGGLTDTENSLRALAAPLAPDHELFYIPGYWDNPGEDIAAKTARIRTQLTQIAEEHGPLTGVGVSAGGPVLLEAGHDVAGVEGFVTLSSPLQPPDRMTVMLRAARRFYPQLPALIARVAETVLPYLPTDIVTFSGTRDLRVPPRMSRVPGADNQIVQTPLTVFATHSYNVRKAFSSPELRGYIAATAGVGR